MKELVKPKARASRSRRKPVGDAVSIRPADVEERYGIAEGTQYNLFRRYEEDAKKGLPHEKRGGLRSISIKGRGGRRGTRLVRVADVEALLDRNEVGKPQGDK